MVLALAVDHVIRDTPAFIAACRQGLVATETGRVVAFGIKPKGVATEYGYIWIRSAGAVGAKASLDQSSSFER